MLSSFAQKIQNSKLRIAGYSGLLGTAGVHYRQVRQKR